jgi:5-dehydro-2-deoxygluconokinase
MAEKSFDLLAMGRSSIDLYSDDIGAPFVEITRFAAYVGGCPTNVSVGVRRLGLRTALLTAVGDDLVGDFVLHFLQDEQVETRFIPRKPGRRTSAVLLGIQPPDSFPLVFYRDNCADNELTIDDVLAAPVADCRVLFISGTGLSREPSRSATIFAAEVARAAGGIVCLDLDLRPDLWHDCRAFGAAVRQALPLVHVAIGTEEEVQAAAGESESIERLLRGGLEALVVKHGSAGATVHTPTGAAISAAPFPVEVLNVLGAGDAFASGFIYSYLRDGDWRRAARMGNASGAIVVTRPACANSMPTLAEVEQLVGGQGPLPSTP